MKKLYDPKIKVEDLWKWLKKTEYDEIIIRTTRVAGGWHDNEFDAHHAGFDIFRFNDSEMSRRHEFSECYHLVRREA